MFDFNLGGISSWIKDGGYTSVALQLPEGLKVRALEISDFLKTECGVDAIILGHPCYGACDVFVGFKAYAEALIHFGHSPIPSQHVDADVLYVEARSDACLAVEDIAGLVRDIQGRVGLLASVQYVGLLPRAKEILEGFGLQVRIGRGDDRIAYPGQVLGCNCSSAESVMDDVDSFIFIGEGDFHPLATMFGSDRKVLVLNPMTKEVRDLSDVRDRILRRRFAAIESSREAKVFLIIVCGKIGQNRMEKAKDALRVISECGRRGHIVMMDEVTPDSLLPFNVDAYVNTACPRIAMDESVRFKKPMLTLSELEIALGQKKWEDYRFDTI